MRWPESQQSSRSTGTIKTLGKCAARLFVRPEPSADTIAVQLRREAVRQESYFDQWNAERRAQMQAEQNHRPWHRRLRPAPTIIALAASVIGMSVGIGSIVDAAPVAVSTTFSADDSATIKTTFANIEHYWQRQGIGLTTGLVLLSGKQTYACPIDTTGNTPPDIDAAADVSEFCPSTNTVVVTAGSFNGWDIQLGSAQAAAYLTDGHEIGHAVSALLNIALDTPSDPDTTQAQERLATCFAGVVTNALNPAIVNTIHQGIAQNMSPDAMHGSTEGQAYAFVTGARNDNCSFAAFYWPGGTPPH